MFGCQVSFDYGAAMPSSTVGQRTGGTLEGAAGRSREPRRERQRRELIDEICSVARRQLAEGGAAGVSWRAIAREVGMGPASLYTYFPSLDALFTELILRSFSSLAAAVAEATTWFEDAPVGDRLLVGPLAYRAWALRHPQEFNLIFSDQIPGFAATPGGPTVEAQRAIFRPVAAALRDARSASPDESAAGFDPDDDPTVDPPPERLSAFLGLWGLFHGLVSLEVNHHLEWVDSAAVIEDRLRKAIDAEGLPAAAADVADRLQALLDAEH